MAKAIPTTDHQALVAARALDVDEWVWYGEEMNREVPGKGLHRIQAIVVRRGDLEVAFKKDLGSVLLYPDAIQFNSWFAGLYRAGEVLEIMERQREGKDPEPREPGDLWGQWLKDLDEKRQQRAHRSSFGRSVAIQRS